MINLMIFSKEISFVLKFTKNSLDRRFTNIKSKCQSAPSKHRNKLPTITPQLLHKSKNILLFQHSLVYFI